MLIDSSTGIESLCPRCCWRYRAAIVTADEAESPRYRTRPLRHQRRPRFDLLLTAINYCSAADSFSGVAADISHINTKSKVTGYQPGAAGLKEALAGAEIVLIPAGVPRKPGMTRDGTPPHYPSLCSSVLTPSQIFSTPTPPSSVISRKPPPTPHPMPRFL